MNRKRPTIHDVAEAANTSKSVVSRVISGTGSVSQETRERVEAAIAQLGYRPVGSRERASGSRPIGTIGVLLRNVTSPFYAELFANLQEQAAIEDMRVVGATGNMIVGSETSALQSLLELGVDALIVGSGRISHRALARIAENIPTVAVGRPAEGSNASSVMDDPAMIARIVVERIWDGGHRRALLLDHPESFSARPRAVLIRALAREYGLDLTHLSAGYEVEHGTAAIQTWLEAPDDETVVIGLAPGAALGSLDALAKAGISVPRDVSVVSTDTLTFSLPFLPELSGTRRDARLFAQALWQETLRRLDHPRDPREIHHPVEWQDGETLGPVMRI